MEGGEHVNRLPADRRIGGASLVRSWFARVLIAALLLPGCSGTGTPAPVTDRGGGSTSSARMVGPAQPAPPAPPVPTDRPAFHTVRRGETLWAIAAAHDLDVEQLAAWNRLTRSHQLRTGQRLRLAPPESSRKGVPKSQAAIPPDRTPPPAPSTSEPETTAPAPVGGPKSWVWPHSGPLIARFGQDGPIRNPGIDIAVTPGDRVVAAADGVVAYADQGLTNFGNMILLRHGASIMSAYAHLDQIQVKPGQSVRAGETIGLAGQTGVTPSPRLHFEIRRSIAPQNPLWYLPRRE